MALSVAQVVNGLVLGNYIVLDKIGAGGMGQVFKAQHRRMKRIVALKVLPPAVTQDTQAIERFQREVEAAAKLSHPNIVTAHDADEAEGVHFLVMEWVDASDLASLVRKNGPLSVPLAVQYILQAARGLEYAHNKGVVHRDIKPANILVDAGGTVKILDMGLARFTESEQGPTQLDLTGAGMLMGTVAYMAPEQARDSKHADQRADVYSLGCTLFFLLTGQSPYQGSDVLGCLYAHQEHPIPPLRSERPDVPPELEDVFRKMLAKKPEERYQSMSQVLVALQACDLTAADLPPSASAAVPQDDAYPTLSQAIPAADEKNSGTAQGMAEAQVVAAVTLTLDQASQATQGLPRPAPPARPVARRGKTLLVAAAVALAILLAGVVFKVKTSSGTLVVEINEPDAVVQVLNEQGKVEITRKDEKGILSITVDPGKHRLKVEKEGFQFFTQDFTMEAGGKATITAKLLPLEEKPPVVGPRNPADPLKEPAFQQWMKQVAALFPGQQVKAVADKLKDLNPGFDGVVTPTIDGGVVTKLEFLTDNVTDISPVRALTGLLTLACSGTHTPEWQPKGLLADLSPLKDMKLTYLDCMCTKVSDLSPLKDMKLTYLDCMCTKVSDLSPLKDMKLTNLNINITKVSDLSLLKNMKLTVLACGYTKVTDLSPLKNMQLTGLVCGNTQVTDLSPLKNMQLTYLGFDVTPVSDLSPLKNMQLTWLSCATTKVADLSALKDMKLTSLNCHDTQVADLSPLKDMQLTTLEFRRTQVSDLSPLKGMPLTTLYCDGTQVADLSPLKGMPLTTLYCDGTQVADLSPLKGLPLKGLMCDFKPERDAEILRSIKTLETINDKPAKEFWKAVDEKKATFDAWLKQVAAMPGEKQVKAVADKLKDLNPGFDGVVTHKIEDGVVTGLELLTDKVTDISPVPALPGLQALECRGSARGKGRLADLSPLKNMQLRHLECGCTEVSDLSPLKDTGLTILGCENTQVSDLSPLKNLKLTVLWCGNTKVSDLSSLKDMPLKELNFPNTQVSDLSPLKDMKLTSLGCAGTKVSDLSPLKDLKLGYLDCAGTPVSDLSPLKDMKLTSLRCASTQVANLSPLKDMELTLLQCGNTQVTDLSPLQNNMKLTGLVCCGTRVADLSPLKDVKLTGLDCSNTQVSDLSPLKGMKLDNLYCYGTKVTDLSPLKDIPLKNLRCDFKPERDAEILRSIKTLETINEKPAKEFWKEVDDKKLEKKP